MENREHLSPFLRQDMNRLNEGAVLGGPIYEDVVRKSRKETKLAESSSEKRFLNILAGLTPLLALSAPLLSACGEGKDVSLPLPTKLPPPEISVSKNEELQEFNATIEFLDQKVTNELEICPDVPPECEIREQSSFRLREGEYGEYQVGETVCFAGPHRENPDEYLVDVWTVKEKDNDNLEAINCLIVCSNPPPAGEIYKICDDLRLFSQEFQSGQQEGGVGGPLPGEEVMAQIYIAQPGDNLTEIAARHDLSLQEILKLNPEIDNPSLILIGQQINVDKAQLETSEVSTPFYIYGVEVTSAPLEVNGFPINPDFQSIYQEYEKVIRSPIARSDGFRQFFTHGVISRPSTINSFYPGMEMMENDGLVRRDPIGWHLYGIEYLELPLIRKDDPEWVNPGEFEIDVDLMSLYQELGGVKTLGIAVSPLMELNEKEKVQWTTHGRLHLNLESGESWLAPLGEEYFQSLKGSNPELLNYLTPFKYSPEEVAKMDTLLDAELKQRTGQILSLFSPMENRPQIDPESVLFRDFWTVAYWSGETDKHGRLVSMPMPAFESAYSILAQVELEFIRNPLIQETAQKMEASGAMEAINRLLGEKVSGDFFLDGQVPLLPETKEEILEAVIFAGGIKEAAGGLGYELNPLLWGLEYGSWDLSPEDSERVKRAFVNQYIHEAVHSFPQFKSKIREDLDAPRGRFIHALHSIPEVMGEWTTGVGKPELYPPIVYVYGVLKEGGVADPLGEMVSSMASAVYLVSYDQVRGEHLPMEVIFAEGHWRQFSPEVQLEIERLYGQYRDEFMKEILRENYEYNIPKRDLIFAFLDPEKGVCLDPNEKGENTGAAVMVEMKPDGSVYFPETDIDLNKDLLELWYRYGHILGLPLSKSREGDGAVFENLSVLVRPEDPRPSIAENPDGHLLGTVTEMKRKFLLIQPRLNFDQQSESDQNLIDPPVPRPENPNIPYFEETGHTLSNRKIAEFYAKIEGEFFLGVPISEPLNENGLVVQYFVNGVVEITSDGLVRLRPIGREVINQRVF